MNRSACYVYLWVLLLIAARGSFAQKTKVFPLQQHKLLWADTVHREAIQKKDSLLLAEAYYLYGKTYEGAGDLLTSRRWYLKSLAILEPLGDSFNLSRLYFRLSRTEYQMEHYAATRRYALLSLGIAQRMKNKRALGLATGMMATLYATDWSRGGRNPQLPKPKPDSADYYWKQNQALVVEGSRKDSLVKLDYYLLRGHKLWGEKRDPHSITFFEKALALAIKENEPTWQFRIMCEMAHMYLLMEKPSQALSILQKADRFLRNSAFKNGHGDWWNLESGYRDYYVSVGDWQKAYEHAEKLHDLERNSYLSDRDGAVSRLSVEYETEKKEALLKAQQKELGLRIENLRVNQRFVWALSALLLLVLGASVVFYQLYRKNQRIGQRNAQLVKEQNHRVKNNLQVVSSLLNLQMNRVNDESVKKVLEESQLRIETMAILHRRLYDTDTLMQVNLDEFIPELVDSVIQACGCAEVQPVYAIESIVLPAERALLVGLILNELATNACKYAFPDHASPVFRISCHQSNQRIQLFVSDNGPGLDSATFDAKSQSFGIRLIQMLSRQLHGTYQFANQNGTQFSLEFSTL